MNALQVALSEPDVVQVINFSSNEFMSCFQFELILCALDDDTMKRNARSNPAEREFRLAITIRIFGPSII